MERKTETLSQDVKKAIRLLLRLKDLVLMKVSKNIFL